jgi:ABC-type nitrate/sulfonate/bicarbonate transport system substrate-binding protein
MRGAPTRRDCIVAAAALAMSTSASARQPVKLTIALSSHSLVAAAPRVAKAMGLFEKHGLDVQFVTMDSANAATAALVSKSADLALSGPGEVIAIQARGQKVVVIASTYVGLGATLVLAKPAADKTGVQPDADVGARLKALDGLVIGTTNATSSYTVSFSGAAKAVGANPRFTFLSVTTMAAALDSGAIAGFIASAPYWAPPVLKGTGVIWISGPKGELPAADTPAASVSLTALQDYAATHSDVVGDVVAALRDLATAIEQRPQDVKTAVGHLFPDLDARSLDVLFASESVAWKAAAPTAQDMRREIDFLKKMAAPIPGLDTVDPDAMILK